MTADVLTWVGRIWAGLGLAAVLLIAAAVFAGRLEDRRQARRDVERVRELARQLFADPPNAEWVAKVRAEITEEAAKRTVEITDLDYAFGLPAYRRTR